MKVKVSLNGPVVLSSEDLEMFVKLVKVPMSIEPVFEEALGGEVVAPVAVEKASRKPRTPKETKDVEPEKKEEIVTKSETETINEISSQITVGRPIGQKPAVTEVDEKKLINAFSELVEKNYDAAFNLLDSFGVSRFSDLTPEQKASMAEAEEIKQYL